MEKYDKIIIKSRLKSQSFILLIDMNKDTKKVFIKNFGCQMNEYDSGMVKDMLIRDGYEEARSAESADIIIVNTCSVRQHAEDRACGYLREAARLKKDRDITLVVMGCMAQREGERLFEIIPELDIVCGVDRFMNLPVMLKKNGGVKSLPEEYRTQCAWPEKNGIEEDGIKNRGLRKCEVETSLIETESVVQCPRIISKDMLL